MSSIFLDSGYHIAYGHYLFFISYCTYLALLYIFDAKSATFLCFIFLTKYLG